MNSSKFLNLGKICTLFCFKPQFHRYGKSRVAIAFYNFSEELAVAEFKKLILNVVLCRFCNQLNYKIFQSVSYIYNENLFFQKLFLIFNNVNLNMLQRHMCCLLTCKTSRIKLPTLMQYCDQSFIQFQLTQAAFTYSKLTIETLEQGVKYLQS